MTKPLPDTTSVLTGPVSDPTADPYTAMAAKHFNISTAAVTPEHRDAMKARLYEALYGKRR